jgi:hypothetical protein
MHAAGTRGQQLSALCARAKREAVPSPFGALRWETSDEHWSLNRRGQLQGVSTSLSTQHGYHVITGLLHFET